ncbi:hypothetical protein AAHC03_026264 [Spirometra sp. Aus1]
MGCWQDQGHIGNRQRGKLYYFKVKCCLGEFLAYSSLYFSPPAAARSTPRALSPLGQLSMAWAPMMSSVHKRLGMLGHPAENNTRDPETWDDLRRPSLIRAALEVPPKAKRQPIMERVARVSVHLPQSGLVKEYLVALSTEAAADPVRWVRSLPEHKRPLSILEVEALDDFVARHLVGLEHMIEYLYEAAFYRPTPSRGEGRIPEAKNYCIRRLEAMKQDGEETADPLSQPFCLFVMPTSPLRTNRDTVRRSVILRFSRLVAPFNQHPTDIQMQVDITDTNYDNWGLLNFWMQNRSFSSPKAALADFFQRPETWRRQPFWRTLPDERDAASADIRPARPYGLDEQGMLKQQEVPPDSVFPGAVINKHVQYRDWSFQVSILRDSGLRFFNITYKSRLMIAEAGLADTVTMYVADTPFMQRMLSLESMYGVGAMWSELSPGIDCPLDAVYLSVPMVATPYMGPKTILRGICLYEAHAENFEGASRRFYAFSNPDRVVHGAPGYATAAREPSLYVVGITALFNYQYSFVNIFSPTGSLSMYVLPTGYVHVETLSAQQPLQPNERFGLISGVWGLQFMLHTHNYLFYLDLDVLDERNVAEVIEVSGAGEGSAAGGRGTKDSGFGISMNRRTLQYEREQEEVDGGGKANEGSRTPQMRRHRICKGKAIDKHCLEVINTAPLPSMFSEETTRSYAWVRKDIWINRYHDNEREGSSIYNGVDLADPFVDFTTFTSDNESMVDEDLVVWANVGFCHIPSSEDFPHTSMHYSTYSVVIRPINFFDATPDLSAGKQVFTKDINDWLRGYALSSTDQELI